MGYACLSGYLSIPASCIPNTEVGTTHGSPSVSGPVIRLPWGPTHAVPTYRQSDTDQQSLECPKGLSLPPPLPLPTKLGCFRDRPPSVYTHAPLCVTTPHPSCGLLIPRPWGQPSGLVYSVPVTTGKWDTARTREPEPTCLWFLAWLFCLLTSRQMDGGGTGTVLEGEKRRVVSLLF
jgi:hypothetical protein